MTAVSFAAPSFSPNQVPLASEPRLIAGSAAPAKSSSPEAATAKPSSADASGTPSGKAPASRITKAELASQIQNLQVKMDKLNPALVFVLDQTTGKALIQLTDRHTHEVIQQFPTAAVLQISKALDRFEKGQLVSKIA